jgi:hypothetical protein
VKSKERNTGKKSIYSKRGEKTFVPLSLSRKGD